MRVPSRVVALTAVFALAEVAGGAAESAPPPPGTVHVVFIAYQNPDQLIEDVKPVVSYLEKAVGARIKYYTATNYAGVVEALRNGSADMGFMGPLQYVIAHDQTGAYPILGEVYNGKSFYTSRIFVRKDSGIASLADLKGKSIAFVDPISSSGYLYPLQTFKDAGLIEDRPEKFFRRMYFAGGDEQAIRSVYNKFVDAAGIGEFAYSLLRAEERDAVTFVAESRPLPSHCVVVRKGLHPETVARLQRALLALNEGPERALLKYLYNVDGYVKVTHEDFKDVEDLARSYGFIR